MGSGSPSGASAGVRVARPAGHTKPLTTDGEGSEVEFEIKAPDLV